MIRSLLNHCSAGRGSICRIRTTVRISNAIAAIFLASPLTNLSANDLPWWCQDPEAGAVAGVAGEAFGKFGGENFGGRVPGQAAESFWGVFGPLPNPGSAMADCVAPQLGGGGGDDEPEPGGGSIYGDPHLYTIDKLHYSFQGAGDYALLENEDFILQARFARRAPNSSASQPTGLALSYQGRHLVIHGAGNSADNDASRIVATIDGANYEFTPGSWYTLAQGAYIQRFSTFWRIEISDMIAINMELDASPISVEIKTNYTTPVAGMLGNNDGNPENDLLTSDGTVVSSGNNNLLLGDFLDNWLRVGSESLFDIPYDESSSGPIRPQQVTTINDFSDGDRQSALDVCSSDLGIAGAGLEDCVYDVLITGEIDFVEDAVTISSITASGISSETLAAASANSIADLTEVESITGNFISGSFTGTDLTHFYRINVPVGETRILKVALPCDPLSGARIAIQYEETVPLESPLTCGTEIELGQGELRLTALAGNFRPLDYEIELLPGTLALGTLPLDSVISGSVTQPGSITGEIEISANTKVDVTPGESLPCEGYWSLIANNDTIATAPTCTELSGTVSSELPNLQLQINGLDVGTEYEFRVHTVSDESNPDDQTAELGDSVILSITGPGQLPQVSFNLDLDERVYISRDEVTNGKLILNHPDGSQAKSTTESQRDMLYQATQAGLHTLVLEPARDFVGDVEIQLLAVADDTTIEVERGDAFELTVLTPGQTARANFNLAAGESIDITTRAELGVLELVNPTGASRRIIGNPTYTATETGVHTFELRGVSGSTPTFSISLE